MSAADSYRLGGWFVAYTIEDEAGERRDFYAPFPGKDAAEARYSDVLATMPGLYCACMGPIERATEPHWTVPGGL